MDALGEQQAVSEILTIFSGLFDGPPPQAVACHLLRDTFPAVRRLLDLPPSSRIIRSDDFEREYEALFLIPTHDHLSPYTSYHRRVGEPPWDSFAADLAALASAMDIPWRKEEFVPGRALPISPDHLSVEMGMAAILLVAEDTGITSPKPAEIWIQRIMMDCANALEEMKNYLEMLQRPPPAYGEVVELAAAFLKECVILEVWDWLRPVPLGDGSAVS
ncbi:molecular chaperone TorD family protein [Acidithiobacillus sulfuriphilus]|uniref:molecular chaperone TorD family protein n=1 Tax=Acidithiobacillus sulfuriphilus TaxID=1867749 RepID=UPI003F60E345